MKKYRIIILPPDTHQFTIKDPLAFSIIIFFTLVFTSSLLIYKTYFSIEMNYHILSKIVILSTLISHTITILIIYLFDNSNILILFNQRLLLPLISLILFYNFYNPGIIPISIRKKGNDVIWF